MDPCQHVTKNVASSTSESSATRAFGLSWNLSAGQFNESPQFLVTDQIQEFGHQRQLHSLGVSHQRYTLHGLRRSGAADRWLQYRDLPQLRRVGCWTSGKTLNDRFKKERFQSTETVSPKKLQTVSVLSQSSRLVSWQSKTTESPTTSPCSHHVTTKRVEEFTPFCAAASSNRALPAPSRLSERYIYHLITWHKNKGQADDPHDTSTDTLGWIKPSHADGGRALELQHLFLTSDFSLFSLHSYSFIF